MAFENLFKFIDFGQNTTLALGLFSVFVITLTLNYLENRYYQKALERLEKSRKLWDDALFWALHKPLGALIWLWGFGFAAKLFLIHTPYPEMLNWVSVACDAGTILLFTWFLLRLTNRLEEKYLAKTNFEDSLFDQTTAQAIAQIIRVAIVITGCMIILKFLFNMPLTGLWAVGGASSIAIGWASKDLLANFFGAVMIFMDRPFSLGDWIKSPDREIEGNVEYIGWRLTRIRTFESRPLYVPNSLFATISVENVSRMRSWRIQEILRLRLEDCDKVNDVTNGIMEMLKAHPHINSSNATCAVNLKNVSPSSLDILLYCYTDTQKWTVHLGIRQDVLLNIASIISKHGAKLAYPTRTLAFDKGEGEFEQAALVSKQA